MNFADLKALLARIRERHARQLSLEAERRDLAADIADREAKVNAGKAPALLDGRPIPTDGKLGKLRERLKELDTNLPDVAGLLRAEVIELKRAILPLFEDVHGQAKTRINRVREAAYPKILVGLAELAAAIGTRDVFAILNPGSKEKNPDGSLKNPGSTDAVTLAALLGPKLSGLTVATADSEIEFLTRANHLREANDIPAIIANAAALCADYETNWNAGQPAGEK